MALALYTYRGKMEDNVVLYRVSLDVYIRWENGIQIKLAQNKKGISQNDLDPIFKDWIRESTSGSRSHNIRPDLRSATMTVLLL